MSLNSNARATRKTVNYDERTEGDSVSAGISAISGATSVYRPPSSSEEDDSLHLGVTKKIGGNKTNDNPTIPLWTTVADDVILCGQQTLHYKNKGNLLYRDYVHACAVAHFARAHYAAFSKKKVITEVFDKLKGYKWTKMNDNNDLLSQGEIRTKIRKAVNDRYNKPSLIQQGQLRNLNMMEREHKRKEFLLELESKLSVHLDFFDVLDYYPNTGNNTPHGTSLNLEKGTDNIPVTELRANEDDFSVRSELTTDIGVEVQTTSQLGITQMNLNQNEVTLAKDLPSEGLKSPNNDIVNTDEHKFWNSQDAKYEIDEDMSVDEPYKATLSKNTEVACDNNYDINSKLNENNASSDKSSAKTSVATMFAESAKSIVQGENTSKNSVLTMDITTEDSLLQFGEQTTTLAHGANSEPFGGNDCVRKPSSDEDSSVDLPRISKKRIFQSLGVSSNVIDKPTKPGNRYYCRVYVGKEQSVRMEYFPFDRTSVLVATSTRSYKSGKRIIETDVTEGSNNDSILPTIHRKKNLRLGKAR